MLCYKIFKLFIDRMTKKLTFPEVNEATQIVDVVIRKPQCFYLRQFGIVRISRKYASKYINISTKQ